MQKNVDEKKNRVWPFRIQFITLALIPLILVTINLPDHITEESSPLGGLPVVGTIAAGIELLFAFPIGMIGFLNARDEKVRPDLNKAAMVMGVINCIVGAMFVGIVLMILCFALFGWI